GRRADNPAHRAIAGGRVPRQRPARCRRRAGRERGRRRTGNHPQWTIRVDHQYTAVVTLAGTAVSVGVVPSLGDWGADLHAYGIGWPPGRIEFFIDDRPTGAVARADVEAVDGWWPFDERPQSPILSLAVGGWAGDPDGTWSRQSMLVDWARIYA